ncbi:hypothetical protein KKD49_18900 [Myxococcota bacterium]|nr:hypothetical protein [Myxococcota bacterium]
MVSIAIEIHAQCRSCGQRIPVNAMVPKVVCDQCNAEVQLNEEQWDILIGTKIKGALKLATGYGQKAFLFSGGFSIFSNVGRADLTFSDKKEPIVLEQVVEVNSGYLFNPRTKGACSVRNVPAEYKKILKGVTHLVGEDLGILAASGVVHEGIKPLLFDEVRGVVSGCPQCGGEVSSEGGQRLVTCPFCATVSYLDDKTYFATCPDRLPRRWFLFLAHTEPVQGTLPEVDTPYSLPPVLSSLLPIPEERRRPVWLSLRMSSRCDTCEAKIPLRALVESVPCARCGSLSYFPPARWFDALMGHLRVLSQDEEGEEVSGFQMGKTALNYKLQRRAPRYPGTRELIPNEELAAALAAGVITTEGGKLTVRELDSEFRSAFPSISLVVGEDPSWVPVESLAAQHFTPGVGALPVPLTCSSCGGSISADGSSRRVSCGYCGALIGLSSDVMRQLHPNSEERTFSFLYDDAMFPVSWSRLHAASPLPGEHVCLLMDFGEEDLALRVLDNQYREEYSIELPADYTKKLNDYCPTEVTLLSGGRLILWPFDTGAWPFFLFDPVSRELRSIAFRGGSGKVSRVKGVVDGGGETILVLHEPEKRPKDMPRRHALLLERFTLSGEHCPTWNHEAPQPGLWKRVAGVFSDGIEGPTFEETCSYPRSFPEGVTLQCVASTLGAILVCKNQVLDLSLDGLCGGERMSLPGICRILGMSEHGHLIYVSEGKGGQRRVLIAEAEHREVPGSEHGEEEKVFFYGERIHILAERNEFKVLSLSGDVVLSQIGSGS